MKPSTKLVAKAVAVSRCMRAHGVTGFPDPTEGVSPANLNAKKYSAIEDRAGVVLAIPNTINSAAPAFKNAAHLCRFPF